MFAITAIYASFLALLFLALSWRVISVRQAQRISLGDGDDKIMLRRIRAQANCAEYMPLGLILLGLAEAQGAPVIAVHLLGLMLLIGRVLHGVALSRAGPWMLGRVGGMLLTLMMIGTTALGLLLHAEDG